MSQLNIKEAIKTALALVIAYAIALSQNWYDPAWAGFAVTMVAMPMFKIEQSFKKAILRLSGTIPGSIGGLIMIAIAPQNRFLFIFCILIWLGVATYLMLSDTKRNYMWNVIGFTMLIVSSTGASSASTAFDHALYRILENLTGIAVYTLVSFLVWPNYKNNPINNTLKKVLGSIDDALNYVELSHNTKDLTIAFYKKISILDEDINLLQGEIDEDFFDELINVKNKDKWNEVVVLLQQVSLSLTNINILRRDLYKHNRVLLEQDIESLTKDLILKVREVKRLVNDKDRFDDALPIIDFSKYADQVNELDKRFLKALDIEYKQLFSLLLKLGHNVEEIYLLKKKKKSSVSRTRFHLVLDREYFKKTAYVLVSVLSSYLIWILFDPPGHNQWYVMLGVNAMAIANLPDLKATDFIMPMLVMFGVITVVYTVLMPLSNNFILFAIILFVYTFFQHLYLRGMAYFAGSIGLMALGIASQQQYDFSQLINGFLFDILYMFWLVATAYIINSTRPEKAFVNSLKRFFKSAHYLFENNDKDIGGLKKKLLFRDIKTIPSLLHQYKEKIDYNYFSGVKKEDIENLVLMVFRISKRLNLIVEHNHINSNNLDVNEKTQSLMNNVKQQLYKISIGQECEPEMIKQYLKNIYEEVKEDKTDTATETYKFINSFKIFYEALHGYHNIRKKVPLVVLKEERFS